MKNENLIIKSLDRLDQRFDGLEQRFDGLTQKVVKHDDQFDLVVRSLLELHGKVDELVSLPARLDAFEDRVTTILDGHSGMLTKLDTERIASISRFERIEGDIVAIKGHLGMRAAA